MTERVLHLAAVNCVLSVLTFKVIVGVWVFDTSGNVLQALSSSVLVLLVSAGLGALFGAAIAGSAYAYGPGYYGYGYAPAYSYGYGPTYYEPNAYGSYAYSYGYPAYGYSYRRQQYYPYSGGIPYSHAW